MGTRQSIFLLILFILQSSLPLLAGVIELPLLPKAVENAVRPRRLFLFVGVNNFFDPQYQRLEFPQKDVDDFLEFIKNNNASDQDLVLKLKGEEATLARVIEALDEIERKNFSELDMVLVYFSTHGTLDFSSSHQLERYTVLYDTNFNQTRNNGLTVAYLENRLSRLRSQRKALILALCHSGSGKSVLPGEIRAELKIMKGDALSKPLHEVSSAMMVLSASSWGEPAREDQNLKNDVYTHFLLEGLQKNDANQDGAISLFEAHEYARLMTYDFTRGSQTPTALVNFKGMDPMILKGRVEQNGFPLVFADSEVWRNLNLKINGRAKGSLWQPRQAEQGNVRVALLDPEHPDQPLVDHYMYLEPNQSYSVSSLLAHRSTWLLKGVVSQIPIDLSVDSTDLRGATSLGLGISLQEILSTPFSIHIEYQRMSHHSNKPIDYEISDLRFHADLFRAGIGMRSLWNQHLSLESGLSLENLSLQRQIANETYQQPIQNLRLLYPSISFECRIMNFLGSWVVGAGAVTYPIRNKMVSWNEKKYAVQPITGRLSLGYSL